MKLRRTIALAIACGGTISGSLLTAEAASANVSVVPCPTNGINVLDFSVWSGHRSCYAGTGHVSVFIRDPFEVWSPWNNFEVYWSTPTGAGQSGDIAAGQTWAGFPDGATLTDIYIYK
ncbi:MAG: hypothetical protein HOV87_11245 [Catenulispora sp.]|nr:hypothetical protein [Catenulispora sp.]